MASMHREDYVAAGKTGFQWTNTHGAIAVAAVIGLIALYFYIRAHVA